MKLIFMFQIILCVLGLSITHFATASADTILLEAVTMLEESNNMHNESQQMIVNANTTRQQINKIRAQSRKTADKSHSVTLVKKAADLAVQLEHLQQQGAILRANSLKQRVQALKMFEQGFCDKWKPWVNNREALTMDDSVVDFIAHNTNIRSTHPSMLNKMGSASQTTNGNTSMSILVPALAAQSAPPNLNIDAFQISREEKYFAHIEVAPFPNGDDTQKIEHSNVAAIPLNKMHKWRFLLSDLKGNPVTNTQIDIEGHMPGHVHGLPTQPQITKEIAAGVYQVEGVKFQMKGWWVIQFNIHSSESKTDVITFNLVL